MDSYFASPERSDKNKINEELGLISEHSLINELMKIIDGLFAVLDENRQILAVNDSVLKKLNINNIESILGARLGEAIKCVYSKVMPCGCGTSKKCASCGAAISIAAVLSKNEVSENDCFIKRNDSEQLDDLYFKIKAAPLHISKEKFVLLFLQDYTRYNLLASLEKSFVHDIGNYSMVINSFVNKMSKLHSENDDYKKLKKVSNFLSREIKFQKTLLYREKLVPLFTYFNTKKIIENLKNVVPQLPHSDKVKVIYENNINEVEIKSDFNLVLRILINMVKNALEASSEQEQIKIGFEQKENTSVFSVWNANFIPEKVQERIFQRHFSTSSELGRGFGTYSMKLLGEKYLGGKVEFTSSKKKGTTFSLILFLD